MTSDCSVFNIIFVGKKLFSAIYVIVGNINEKFHDRTFVLYICVYVLSIKLHFEILLNETVNFYKPI
jgi:hypothetical protein